MVGETLNVYVVCLCPYNCYMTACLPHKLMQFTFGLELSTVMYETSCVRVRVCPRLHVPMSDSHGCQTLLLSWSRQAVQQKPASCDNTLNAHWLRARQHHNKENWTWQKTTSDELMDEWRWWQFIWICVCVCVCVCAWVCACVRACLRACVCLSWSSLYLHKLMYPLWWYISIFKWSVCVCVLCLYTALCKSLTCCVMAKPMTESPSGMSHVTTAEFAFSALMVTLTGGDKLSASTHRNRVWFHLLQNGANEKFSSIWFPPVTETATSMAEEQTQCCE